MELLQRQGGQPHRSRADRAQPAVGMPAAIHPLSQILCMHTHTHTYSPMLLPRCLHRGCCTRQNGRLGVGSYSEALRVCGLPLERLWDVVAPHALGVMGLVW